MTIVNVKKQLKMIFLCHTSTGLLHKLRRGVGSYVFFERKFQDLQPNQWNIKPQKRVDTFPKKTKKTPFDWINCTAPTASFDCAKELVDTTKEGVMDVRNSNETHSNNTSDNYTTKTGRVP